MDGVIIKKGLCAIERLGQKFEIFEAEKKVEQKTFVTPARPRHTHPLDSEDTHHSCVYLWDTPPASQQASKSDSDTDCEEELRIQATQPFNYDSEEDLTSQATQPFKYDSEEEFGTVQSSSPEYLFQTPPPSQQQISESDFDTDCEEELGKQIPVKKRAVKCEQDFLTPPLKRANPFVTPPPPPVKRVYLSRNAKKNKSNQEMGNSGPKQS